MRVCGAGARECRCGRCRCRPRKLLGGERTKHTCYMWPDSRYTNCKCGNHACALMCSCMHTPRCTTVTQPCRKLHQACNERQPTTLHQCAAGAVDPASTTYPELSLIVTARGVAAGAARSRAPVVPHRAMACAGQLLRSQQALAVQARPKGCSNNLYASIASRVELPQPLAPPHVAAWTRSMRTPRGACAAVGQYKQKQFCVPSHRAPFPTVTHPFTRHHGDAHRSPSAPAPTAANQGFAVIRRHATVMTRRPRSWSVAAGERRGVRRHSCEHTHTVGRAAVDMRALQVTNSTRIVVHSSQP